MSITKSNRALLVVCNTVDGGSPKLNWLYQFLDASGLGLAEQILVPHYGTYKKLTGSQATRSAFIDTIQALGMRSSIKAIDVILILHGNKESLLFFDGVMGTSTLRQQIAALNLGHKLRMLYSTACYGATHADDFVNVGFDVACGAVGVNANSAFEYPTVLTMWATGSKFRDAIAVGENILTRAPADELAKRMGFPDANSDKVVVGNGAVTISASQ